jgi:hypothetical protein
MKKLRTDNEDLIFDAIEDTSPNPRESWIDAQNLAECVGFSVEALVTVVPRNVVDALIDAGLVV